MIGTTSLCAAAGRPALAAALAARRGGLKILLLESQGQLGGNGTSGLVSQWLGGRTSDCRRWVVGGIFRTLTEQAAERGIRLIPSPPADARYQPHGWYRGQLAAGIPFDPYGMAVLLDEHAARAGIDWVSGGRSKIIGQVLVRGNAWSGGCLDERDVADLERSG